MTALPRRFRPWAVALLLVTLSACGGGGGRDPVMGFDGQPLPPGTFPPGTVPVATAVPLGAAQTFGAFGGGAGITNMGILTAINNGDIGTTGASSTITGFHDSLPCVYTETGSNSGNVTGLIYTDLPTVCGTEGTLATMLVATNAQLAATAAYNQLAAMPAGPKAGAGQLAGLTLAPGVYTSDVGFLLTNGDLTLDAQGDPNAVFVFQMGTSLTVGAAAVPSSVILAGSAQAKNVFWQVGSAATINGSGGGTFVGTVISQAGTTTGTGPSSPVITVNGRLLSLTSVTLVNTVINVPAP